jgi:DNA-directed RNA polymerase subunit beta'
VIINETDCGTILGLDIGALKEGEKVIEPLKDRILGRVAVEDVFDPFSDELLAKAGEEIIEATANTIEASNVERVKIRSVLTCEARRGCCAKCYGRNLATGKMVNIGEAVGVIAGQSIGEPGTRLTLRTFHIGGTAARIAEQSRVMVKMRGKVVFNDGLTSVKLAGEEESTIVLGRNGEIELHDDDGRMRAHYKVPYGARLLVKDKQAVAEGEPLFDWDPYATPILTEKTGTLKFIDIIDEVTLRDELDEKTGLRQRAIVEYKDKTLHPHIYVMSDGGKKVAEYAIPTGARILVHDGEKVGAGTTLAKIPREISKTRDITGGLPRVAELFEARKPKDSATVSEIDGVVSFGGLTRGLRKIKVTSETGLETEYLIPLGKHLMVREGDRVIAGDRLSDGPINPHDILRIKGHSAVEEYLVNEIQEVYRLQGVRINDKHIEIIVRQMLQKVRIDDPGDTAFLEGDRVDKSAVREDNDRVVAEGGKPATYQPLLLGITKASLSTESFVSAASFQETSRVLTEAAIKGSTDHLLGLKENVIMGNLIPAGTGIARCRRIRLTEPIEMPEEPTDAVMSLDDLPLEKFVDS